MSVANGLIPAVAAKYRASRPGIEIILREDVHGAVLEDIRRGPPDRGATYVDNVPDFVEAKRVSREVFDVILPRGHPLTKISKRSSVTLSELVNFPLVSLPHESRTRRTVDGAASSTGLTLRHVATVTQFTTMMSFVRAGVCHCTPSRQGPGSSKADKAPSQPRRGVDMAAGKGVDPGGPGICSHFRRDVAPQ